MIRVRNPGNATAHQCVGGAGGRAQSKGDEIPADRAQQSREQHFRVQHLDMRQAFAHGRGDGGSKSESGNEIPKGGGGP